MKCYVVMVLTGTHYQHLFSGFSQVLNLVHQPSPLSQRKTEWVLRKPTGDLLRQGGLVKISEASYMNTGIFFPKIKRLLVVIPNTVVEVIVLTDLPLN